MFRFFAATALFCVALAFSNYEASAQSGSMAIAVVDTQAVLRTAKAATAATAQIDAMRFSNQKTVTAKKADLTARAKELAALRSALAPEIYEQRVRAIETELDNAEKEEQAQAQALDGKSAEASRQIGLAIVQVVDEIRTARQIGVVLDRASVIGGTSLPDITADVVKRLDKKMPSISTNSDRKF